MQVDQPTRPLHPLTRSTPFEAPRTSVTAAPPLPRIPHAWVFGLAAAPLVAAFVAFALRSASLVPRAVAAWILLPAALIALSGAVLAIVNLVRSVARLGRVSGRTVLTSALVSVVSGLAALMSSGIASGMVLGSGRGRQLRKGGRPIHAELHDDTPWLPDAPSIVGDVELEEVAHAWRTNGKTEHASVAAFAELSLDLVALGAPPRLIEAAHQDALDEMRHTELCFALARDLDGRRRGPRDFAAAARLSPRRGPRALQLARLAVTSLYDGALYEGLSARVVAGLARGTIDPRVRATLEAIARDEARHAAHGFEVVRWCAEVGGAPVVRALEVAVDRMRGAEPHALIDDPRAADGRWEHWGIPGRARELAAWAVVRERVVTRTERLISGPSSRAITVA